ncbi:hypothetical protein WA026_005519 [Henosepilachna vigintioctopunctata]|uniref:Spaetzle domain-containing protein n=1 Tax=Henosepilachna vigintioctopunctata TaxID=420089 RepID=A0AAW1TV83_9CUCU
MLLVHSFLYGSNDQLSNITSNGERTGKLRIISFAQQPVKELKSESRKRVVFPGQKSALFGINGVPTCANGETFCENHDAYPENHIRNILKGKKELGGYFGREDDEPFIVNRNSGLQEPPRFLCPSLQKTIAPKVAQNKNDEWKFIVNQKVDGYIQTVRVELCRKENAACDIIGGLPLGYTTFCKQKYIYRRLLSLDTSGQPIPDMFKLPVACCCSFKQNYQSRIRSQIYSDLTPPKSTKLS